MSDQGSEKGEEPVEVAEDKDEEEGEQSTEYNAPISALPPRVVPQEESQMEVSSSPAFQCLDDVSSALAFLMQICKFLKLTNELF